MWTPFAIAVLAGLDEPAETVALNLVCTGGGAAIKLDSSTTRLHDNYGNTASGTVDSTSRVGFADQVDIRLAGTGGSARLPRMILPAIRGGKDGWFDLKKVVITRDRITAKASVNPVNNPTIHIDRRTGNISIDAKGGQFTGTCEKVESGAANKF